MPDSADVVRSQHTGRLHFSAHRSWEPVALIDGDDGAGTLEP